MDTYDFPYFQLEQKYPDHITVQFGGGYEFAPNPTGPDQDEFVLHYDGMWFFQTYNEEEEQLEIDLEVNAQRNMGALDQFYKDHKIHVPFLFVHPIYGEVTVRFSTPLAWKIKKDGRGLVDPFQVRLKLLP